VNERPAEQVLMPVFSAHFRRIFALLLQWSNPRIVCFR